MDKTPFSFLLERWHKATGPKTLRSLSQVFAQKSFAIIILLLMATPALPLPTGGITHIFEIITMLLAIELVVGRRFIWLPKKWLNINISGKMNDKVVPYIARRIQWFERFSKPRLSNLINDPRFIPVVGLLIFVSTFGAFVAPPFSGLDTLPALGVVVMALSLILEDAALLLLGIIVSGIGIGLEIGVVKALIDIIRSLF